MLIRLITAYLCNLIDTIATVYFYIVYDGTELNPISAELLRSPPLFVAFKLIVMTIAVTFIWWKRDWKFCKVTSWVLFVEYLLVTIYYIILIALITM